MFYDQKWTGFMPNAERLSACLSLWGEIKQIRCLKHIGKLKFIYIINIINYYNVLFCTKDHNINEVLRQVVNKTIT